MGNEIQVSVELTNEKLRFAGVAGENAPIQIDYLPPLGDGQGYTPLQLLLIGLAGCSASTVVSILRKMGKEIRGCSVNGRGERQSTHPTVFTRISLEFIVEADHLSESEVQHAINRSEETYCPVWAMLKGNVEIDSTIIIK